MSTHIFWDWNGTLYDDAWLCMDVMNRMLIARGREALSAAQYESIFTFPIENYYKAIGFDLEAEPFERLGAEFIRGYEGRRMEASLYPDVLPALERVNSLGWTQSILSAYAHETLVTLVEAHGLNPFFADLHGHDHIYPAGKEPQGMRAMDDLKLNPADCVMIGDTVHDAEVADHLGIRCILIHGGNQPLERLRATGHPMAESRMDALDMLEKG